MLEPMSLTRSTRRHIPSFSLYGEQLGEAGRIDALHIEDIPSRSRKYLWKIGSHRHAKLSQCVFVTSGPVIIDLEESHVEFEGPALIIIPAGTVHGFGFRSESQGFVLTVDLDRLLGSAAAAQQSMIVALFDMPRAVQLGADRAFGMRTSQLFATLLLEFNQPDSLVSPVTGWLTCSILWTLASRVVASAPPRSVGQDLNRLRRFRTLVEAHYLQHWPVERYAKRLAVSQSSLNRLCGALTGSTAFEIVQQRLALEARRRLVYVTGSVATIAAELGFKDSAYFCRFFRKHMAESPTVFRRRHGGG
jgi:AraC family transcriptional activator of pobA